MLLVHDTPIPWNAIPTQLHQPKLITKIYLYTDTNKKQKIFATLQYYYLFYKTSIEVILGHIFLLWFL